MPRREPRDLAGVEFSHFKLLEANWWEESRELAGGWSMPNDLAVRVDELGQAHVIELVIVPWEGRLEAGRVTVTRRDDTSPPVDHKALRFPLASYVAGAVAEYLRRPTADPDELLLIARIGRGRGGRPTSFKALGPDDQNQAADTIPHFQGRRRDKRENLLSAAEHYRKALRDPMHQRAPTQYVADEMGYTRGHASRLLSEARSAGLLGPARGTRGGELRRHTDPQDHPMPPRNERTD